ncbi:hypothetical protein MTR67_044536 [Solanum verrucosum]|uniref:Uncharacterized protein n=1 Tax=Solanum verrucosum TaxID=315347 RepID=A0AAF0ZTP7_SOLVR|nr:hypothetical protein MTR67_044536 [Solanum verrucosum]
MFRNAIQMLTKVVANQVGQQRVDCQDMTDTSRIRKFLRMNPQSSQGQRSLMIQRTLCKNFRKILRPCMLLILRVWNHY